MPFFLEASCRLGDHVTFAVGRGADGLEAYDLKVVGRGASRCVPVFVGFVVDNSGSALLVLLVTKQLAQFFPFPSSGPRCATSWLIWTRRTENAGAHLQAPRI